MTDDLCEVIITAPERDWLVDLCRQLVEARLASSAHVVHPDPASTAGKERCTRRSRPAPSFVSSAILDEIVAYVVDRHPYEVPNVTALPIIGGNPAYLDWIRSETERDESQA